MVVSPVTSDKQIKQQIEEVRLKLDNEWRTLEEVFNKIKNKNDEISELKIQRDGYNQLVKTLINEGKEKQKERNKIQESVKPKREVISKLILNIKEYAKQISELKDIRDGKHREAKGSLEGLMDNIAGSLTTLLSLDLTLKEEIMLFDMIFSSKDRYYAKVSAEDIHNQIQKIYKALKATEQQVQDEEDQISKIFKDSQLCHNESVAKFKEKDEMRNKSNSTHQQVVDGFKQVKEYRFSVNEIKKSISDLKAEMNKLYKLLRASDKKRQDMKRQEKLDDAKEKLKGEKKMGLDELRLLIESGELKE